ncbi:WxcM-like domain-containing protein [Flammeovirga pectinis]|uniref:WxcM-like domain-containing protein n=1 Tax=Flammeovirga pectinis TaxID=2494373 RepID=A0A3S9P150_9BACT|nr:FdtA/QdtA family cupin domain-containing protein [Flammeovirga pectinis]AZQ61908.1 WxcM-like domain-containing protein [Flammeovirga pectinis]
MRQSNLDSCKIVSLPKIPDRRGNLSFFETDNQIPFKIERTYWIYDVPGGEIRGGHAYKKQNEFIIALSGSLDVIIEVAHTIKKISLNRSYEGLFIPSGIWRHMENFSTNSLALVVSDTEYDAEDYIRDKNIFYNFCDENAK